MSPSPTAADGPEQEDAADDDDRTVVDAAPAGRPRNTELELVALFAALESSPRTHDFFAVLRRIENLRPDRPRFGKALRPLHEAVRLGQEPELDFAPAAIERFDAGSRAPRLGTRFFGLLGPQGPMPLHFTEHVRERARSRNDPTTARFLDLFHHRLLSLFYRTWAENQPTVQHDRPAEDRYAAWLGASFGAETRPAAPRALPEAARLFQAGLLGTRSRHPEGLAKLIGQHFRVPVRIEEHVLHWLVPHTSDRLPLGFSRSRPERVGQRSAQLGVSATSGRRWRDRNSKFRVVIGPLSRADYERFLPDGRAWRGIAEWVRQYAGLDLRWDLQLVLAGPHVPEP
ncbi:MAG TPA: type VI secretion system baseplate subunit TssG, partial [Geminicoccaceae bacterium]